MLGAGAQCGHSGRRRLRKSSATSSQRHRFGVNFHFVKLLKVYRKRREKKLHRKFWLQVFDATNSTTDRREMIKNIVVDKMGYKLFFVESVCDDPNIIEQNIMVSILVSYICFLSVLKLMNFLQRFRKATIFFCGLSDDACALKKKVPVDLRPQPEKMNLKNT